MVTGKMRYMNKRYLLPLGMFVLFGTFFLQGLVYADEIYLKDATVVKGKVLRVTGKNIEIDPEGEIPFDTIPRENVKSIVYSDKEHGIPGEKNVALQRDTGSTENHSGPFYLSIGIGLFSGFGWTDYKDYESYYNNDGDGSALGWLLLSGHLSVGYMFSDYIHSEAYGMIGSFFGAVQNEATETDSDPDSDYVFATFDVANIFAAVKLYPLGYKRFGLFGKFGLGYGWTGVDYTLDDDTEKNDSAGGYAYMFGGGLEFPIGIAICLEYFHQQLDDDLLDDSNAFFVYVSYTAR